MTIEQVYEKHVAAKTAISAHLPRLRHYASGLSLAVEFGVKRGASSAALLLGAERVVSYDTVRRPEAVALKAIAGNRWDYRIEDSRTATVPDCDLLFVDSLHTFEQVDAELRAHADKVSRWLIFHDVSTFGEVGAVAETGRQAWQYQIGQSVPLNCLGIRPAVDSLMVRDPSWFIEARFVDSHGLLVLERRP